MGDCPFIAPAFSSVVVRRNLNPRLSFAEAFIIYLHDTPLKELLNKNEPAFSSGCIRVQDPLPLAEYLLNDADIWNRNKIDKVVATRITRTIQLKGQLNVHLLYWTAWVDSNNTVNFRKDIY